MGNWVEAWDEVLKSRHFLSSPFSFLSSSLSSMVIRAAQGAAARAAARSETERSEIWALAPRFSLQSGAQREKVRNSCFVGSRAARLAAARDAILHKISLYIRVHFGPKTLGTLLGDFGEALRRNPPPLLPNHPTLLILHLW